jgi:predicted nucleic acid-binding protein
LQYAPTPGIEYRYITLAKRKEFLENLAETAEFINITEQVNECRDPKDNKYLELVANSPKTDDTTITSIKVKTDG